MNTHSTNCFNSFIEVAEDCRATTGEVPPLKENSKSLARLQFELLHENPYRFTSDDVLFHAFAVKNNLGETELEAAREQFFSKGQPCMRASPLPKRYGWGVHCNEEGKIAIFGKGTEEYKNLSCNKDLKILKAMRSSRK